MSVAKTWMAAAFLAKSPVSNCMKTLLSVFKAFILATSIRADGRRILIGAPQGSERARKGLQVIPCVYISRGRVLETFHLLPPPCVVHIHGEVIGRVPSFTL